MSEKKREEAILIFMSNRREGGKRKKNYYINTLIRVFTWSVLKNYASSPLPPKIWALWELDHISKVAHTSLNILQESPNGKCWWQGLASQYSEIEGFSWLKPGLVEYQRRGTQTCQICLNQCIYPPGHNLIKETILGKS